MVDIGAGDIFNTLFNKNHYNLIKITLDVFQWFSWHYIVIVRVAFVRIAWRRTGDLPLSETVIVRLLTITGLVLGLRPANERRRYFAATSFIGSAQP